MLVCYSCTTLLINCYVTNSQITIIVVFFFGNKNIDLPKGLTQWKSLIFEFSRHYNCVYVRNPHSYSLNYHVYLKKHYFKRNEANWVNKEYLMQTLRIETKFCLINMIVNRIYWFNNYWGCHLIKQGHKNMRRKEIKAADEARGSSRADLMNSRS